MLNLATIAAIVAACWAHPQGVAYLAKIDQIQACAEARGNPCCAKGGGSKQAKKAKRIIIEQIEDLDDLVEQLAEVTADEPKVKSILRQAKKQKPESREFNEQSTQAWISYYELVIAAMRDQQRAQLLLDQLQAGIDHLNALLAKQEMQQYLQQMMDEDMFAMFMLIASAE